MMLKIYLLGQFKLEADHQEIELPSRPAQSLLAYLVLNAGITQRREKLACLLWPEASDSNARGYLRQALWRIRKSFTDCGLRWEDYLKVSGIDLFFNDQADYWSDVHVLMRDVPQASTSQVIEIINLYRGELLPGFYDEWILVERDRLQAAYHRKMNLLIECLLREERWHLVLKWCEEWIRLGYAPEGAFRAMMQAYAGLGDQSMLQATYQRCEEALHRELDLQPSPETRKLYTRLSHSAVSADLPPDVRTVSAPVQTINMLDIETSRPVQEPVFVARERELARLDHLLEKAVNGEGRAVFITGEAGSGKTALLEVFTCRAIADHPDLVVARGNCNAHTGAGDPYLPFREILELLTGDIEARWAAGTLTSTHAQRLWKSLPVTGQALVDVGPALIDTFIIGTALLQRSRSCLPGGADWLVRLGSSLVEKPPALIASNPLQADLLQQYTRVIQAVARQTPLMLMIDDLQWADAGSINLLFHLGRELGSSRVLIIGAYRPEEVALGRNGTRHPLAAVVHELQRLSGEAALDLEKVEGRNFVEVFLDTEPNRLDSDFREMLWRQTRGHPLFTIELLRGMQERGDVVQNQAGEWIEGKSLDWETLPARVEAVIAERIERLSTPLRAALRAASVEGEIFTAEVIARVIASDERELLNILSRELDQRHRLVRTERIHHLGNQILSSYRFRHILFQKYLYNSLDEVERVHLHKEVGISLEELYTSQEEIPVVAIQLARHFEEAGIWEKAVHYLHQAGERAIHLSAYQEGITHLDRALEMLNLIPDSITRSQQEIPLYFALGLAAKYQGPTPQGIKAINRARELCQQTGEIAQLARVLSELSIYYYVQAEYKSAIEFASEALDLAQQAQEPELMAECHWNLGFVKFCLGEYSAARDSFAQVIGFYNPERHHRALILLRGVDAGLSALAYDACCLWCLGYPDQALKRSLDALSLARRFEHAFTLADVLCYAGCMLNAMRKDAIALKENSEALIRLAKEKNLRGWLGTATAFLGEAITSQGMAQEAISLFHEGLAISIASGAQLYKPALLRGLAIAQADTGDLPAGLATLAEALLVMEQTGEHHWKAEGYRLQAELLAIQRDDAAAEASYLQAIEISRRQQAKSWELRASIGLAHLWHNQGRTGAAHRMLAEIYNWFTEGFETPDLVRARQQLEEMEEKLRG